jgi:pilus assembly protein CpaC
MRRSTRKAGRSRLLSQILMTAAATLVVIAAVPAVQAYLSHARPPAAETAPRFEHRIPNGLRVVTVREGREDVLERVELEKGKSLVLAADFDVERVAVGDPSRAGVVMIDARTVQVVGKEPGDTNVLLWNAQGQLVSAVDFHVGVGQNQMLTELRRVLGEQKISVDMAGESIVLRGTVYSIQDRERAEQVATAFFKGELKPGEKDPHVINLIDVSGNHQVMIEVVIAEMNRNIGRELEVDWQTIIKEGTKAAAFGSLLGGGALAGDIAEGITSPGGGLFAGVVGGSTEVRAFLRLARKKGLAKILAEPTLVARSGQKANFLAGGEVPLLEPSGLGTVSVKLKPFGVGIDFLPTVLGPDRIHMEITPEVSEPDESLGIQVQGILVPGFSTRRATTAVELADGQSFAIAGLLQDKVKSAIEKVPGLGDIPVLGALFSSQEFQQDETELVIIVTPRLVKPLDPGPRPLPTDHFKTPDDIDFYLLGRGESRKRHPHADAKAASAEAKGADSKKKE